MNKQKNKKADYLKPLLLAAILIGVIVYLILTSPISAHASGFFNLPDSDSFGGVPAPEGDDAIEQAENIATRILRPLRIIMAAVGVLLIVLYGFTLVVAGRNEQTVETQKRALWKGIIGLALISIAGTVSEVFSFQEQNIFGSEENILVSAGLFNEGTTLIITFMKYILGSVAVFTIVRSGFVMVVSGGAEESTTREKKNLLAGFVALAFVMIGDFFVKKVIFNVEQGNNEAIVSIDAASGVKEIAAITNFMVSFIGPFMVLGIVAGGLMYAMAGGDEERAGKAKKILVNSAIGSIVIYGAYALVATMIGGAL
ncbi:MAG: hypothetical protein ACD_51C00155G0003 [uncultured bacterium]|nr:MAG: hypothetical protein ACD_51C00155G0003 [uncultured bacterium]OGJ47632.1 MAG: hypothetical protein A2244_02745 [Candidatus Peregrinibacteria bacterium RIFOXYA2_FULL_41_18]OGJ51502.1 MAG: hypothetical protein A2336_02300 [Candidatus Peregrinibacteria bacterium RIFOXYB2_FULL_41_88]OGJ52607.1 MAG: hypothetical protein A2448_02510 [Candidatus Peregrinibacteria bacterium RIFOXYC2_FULL_41_22]